MFTAHPVESGEALYCTIDMRHSGAILVVL
jgi:hypothetical protein